MRHFTVEMVKEDEDAVVDHIEQRTGAKESTEASRLRGRYSTWIMFVIRGTEDELGEKWKTLRRLSRGKPKFKLMCDSYLPV